MILSIHRVSESGAISLVAANLPYSNVQWDRAFSTCGTFAIELACALPCPWPGRYVLTRDDRREVGVVEKANADEDSGGESCSISGRFAESFLDRWRPPHEGASAKGATWRQAATAAMSAWRMPDAPAMKSGDGTEDPSGSGYEIFCDAGKSGMEAVYEVTAANGARPLFAYDRDADASTMRAEIVDGLDRTRGQSERPICIFSLSMGTTVSVSYSGDYSCACSVVYAHAESGSGDDAVSADASVAVPGFDPSTQWMQAAYEDVSSLIGEDAQADAESVAKAGELRCYDHLPALSVECGEVFGGYIDDWDLGDTVEVEIPSIGLVASMRIEECREVSKPEGDTVGVVLGTKRISRIRRALMGRR